MPRPLTLRTALVAAALVLLLVAAVTAAGLIVREWVSTGPGGPQYTDDLTIGEVYRDAADFYSDLHIGADGRALLAMRVPVPWPDREPAKAAIVRFDLSGGGRGPVDVLSFERLRDPALWIPGTDVTSGGPGRTPHAGPALSVAPNGDLFVAASMYPGGTGRMPGASTIVVAGSDGTVARVVTSGELVASGLFDRLDEVIGMTAVASAPELLWARVDGRSASGGSHAWLFQVAEPNADGDWSDRLIRPLTLPPSVPSMDYGVYERAYGSLVAEPSIEGRDGRGRSSCPRSDATAPSAITGSPTRSATGT